MTHSPYIIKTTPYFDEHSNATMEFASIFRKVELPDGHWMSESFDMRGETYITWLEQIRTDNVIPIIINGN